MNRRAVLFLPVPLILLSGCAGLALEVVWMRALRLVFGQGPDALALVLAVFLGGLALGAAVLGPWADRQSKSPLLIYGILEIIAGLFAMLVPLGLELIGPLIQSSGLESTSPLGRILRFGFAAIVLIPPTFFMGGTLPVLSRLASSKDSGSGAFVTRLYGFNTLGAALGALLATVWTLPQFGLKANLFGLPVLPIAVGLLAIMASRLVSHPSTASKTPSSTPQDLQTKSKLLWALVFISGVLTLSMEVAFARIYTIYLGQATYGFGLMTTGFVLGLGTAAIVAPRLGKLTRNRALATGLALSAAGLALVFSRWSAPEVSLLAARWGASLASDDAAGLLFTTQFVAGLAVLFIPTFALGLVFPLSLEWLTEAATARGRRVGRAYALNTFGCILGATASALFVVPWLSPLGTLLVGGIVASVLGVLLALRNRHPQGILIAAGALVATMALSTLDTPWHRQLLLRSPAVYGQNEEDRRYLDAILEGKTSTEVIYSRTDQVATVAVGQSEGEHGEEHRFFAVNGKSDGSDLPVDMMNQVRLADWPMAFHGGSGENRKFLIIGLGTGVTAAQSLRYPCERVDVIEISDAVREMAHEHFSEQNGDVLGDPKLRLIEADGRHFAASTDQSYDVIVSEPSNPWVAGMGFLFTRECFEILSHRLNEGGVFGQWIQTYGLSEDLFRSLIASFVSVFPTSYLVSTYAHGWDTMLIGCREGAERPKLDSFLHVLSNRRANDTLELFSLSSIPDLCTGLLMGPDDLRDYVQGAVPNTDDNGRIEFEAPWLHARRQRLGVESFQSFYEHFRPADSLLDFGEHSDSWREAARALQIDAMASMRLQGSLATVFESRQAMSSEAYQALSRIAALALGNENRNCGHAHLLRGVLHHYASVQLDDGQRLYAPFAPGFALPIARQSLQRAVEVSPTDMARITLARNLEYSPEGIHYGPGAPLDRALDQYRLVSPKTPGAAASAAMILARLDRWEEARNVLIEAQKHGAQDPTVDGTLALVLTKLERYDDAVDAATRAVQRVPNDPGYRMTLARALMGLGRKDEAREQARQASNIAPGDPSVRALLYELSRTD